MLQNGSFSDGWETLPAIREANYLKNQRPHGWEISWLNPGEPLYDDPGATASSIPECVHKLSDQLPANERLGGANALILAGDAVYKIFSAFGSFGAALSQTVTGLQPGSTATLTVPIQVHLRGETDPYGAESGVWVNGQGGWVNGFEMGDHRWYKHEIKFTVPDDGRAEIVIRVKNKWPKGKDFFIDEVTLEAVSGETPPPPPPDDSAPAQTIYIQVPPDVKVEIGRTERPNVVEVNAGPGVRVEQV